MIGIFANAKISRNIDDDDVRMAVWLKPTKISCKTWKWLEEKRRIATKKYPSILIQYKTFDNIDYYRIR